MVRVAERRAEQVRSVLRVLELQLESTDAELKTLIEQRYQVLVACDTHAATMRAAKRGAERMVALHKRQLAEIRAEAADKEEFERR